MKRITDWTILTKLVDSGMDVFFIEKRDIPQIKRGITGYKIVYNEKYKCYGFYIGVITRIGFRISKNDLTDNFVYVKLTDTKDFSL